MLNRIKKDSWLDKMTDKFCCCFVWRKRRSKKLENLIGVK